MIPLSGLSNLEKLEDLKYEIKSVLIADGNKGINLDQLSNLYRSETGCHIPFKDFNYSSLEDFLSSIPDAVSLVFDKKNNSTIVYHVESSKTSHLTSLIDRQKKTNKKPKKSVRRLKHGPIDPIVLTKVMLKLANHSIDSRGFKKIDLLSEIQAIVGAHFSYEISDLNVQLNKLNNILIHDDHYVYLKNKKKSHQHLLEDCIKDSTKARLQNLAKKYTEGIWCSQIPDVYRKEYGIDLEYRDLGFCGIDEFVAILPNIFQCIIPPDTSKYKVIAAGMPVDHAAASIHSSFKVSKLLIPMECMKFEDSVEQIQINILMDKLDVIISEICSPSLFWIILRRNKRKLIKLMDNLQKFYAHRDLDRYRIPLCLLKPGLHVACIYSNRWHRGIIKKVELDSLMIFFHDYGTMKFYKSDKLYFLHKKFSILPAQAITCGLYNVIPMESDEWTEVAIKTFVDKTIEKNFVASVYSRNREDNSLAIDLIDTAADTVDIRVTEWMVFNGLATRETHLPSHKELAQNSNYVSPAKQLEALKKYKTRFQSFEMDNCEFTKVKENEEVLDKNIHVDDKKIIKENVREALKELEKLITCTNL